MFPIYPYINVNDLNLDYLQLKVKALEEIVKNFVSVEGMKIADPITWNITTQYAKNTVVLDDEGNAYLSITPVPAGILLTNADYWLVIFNFMDYIKSFNSNVTVHEERNTTKATATYVIGDWLLIDDLLYVVTQNIAIDDTFTEGTNINRATIEDVVKAYKNDIDASELAFTNNLQEQFDLAISGVTVDSEVILARLGYNDITYANLGTAIRTQISDIYDELISDKYVNKVSLSTHYNGYYTAAGTVNTDASWQNSGLIPIQGSELYIDFNDTSDLNPAIGHTIVFFNNLHYPISESEFVTDANTHKFVAIPSNAAYVLISQPAGADWVNAYIRFSNRNERNTFLFETLKDLNLVSQCTLDDIITSGYVNASGSITPAPGWYHTNLIRVNGVFKLILPSHTSLDPAVGWVIAFYDNDHQFISGMQTKEYSNLNNDIDAYITPPSGARYVIISNPSSTPWNTAYIETSNAKMLTIVSKDGTGDYSTVSEAVSNSADGDIIYIKSGVYDNEHVKAWGKNLTIIGESKTSTIIKAHDTSYNDEVMQFSVGTLKNVYIIDETVSPGTYALHCQDDAFQYGKSMTLENCRIESTGVAIGVGFSGETTTIFKDCEFITTANAQAMYLHDENDPAYYGSAAVDFVHCDFINHGNRSIMIESMEQTGGRIIAARFDSCHFYGHGYAPDPFIYASNYHGGTPTPDDWLGLINWRLSTMSTGNNLTSLNALPIYT